MLTDKRQSIKDGEKPSARVAEKMTIPTIMGTATLKSQKKGTSFPRKERETPAGT